MEALGGAAHDLQKLLNTIVPIPDGEWEWLAARFDCREYAAGDVLFRPGEADASIHYLHHGLVRYFYLSEDGKERNHSFAAEGNLVGCLPAYIGAGPCTFTVEALEKTTSIVIPSDIIKTIDNRHMCWSQFKLRLMEHVAIRKEEREAEFLTNTAETRYRNFLTRYTALVDRIPQYHIASFLGITPVGLSRIRKRVNLG